MVKVAINHLFPSTNVKYIFKTILIQVILFITWHIILYGLYNTTDNLVERHGPPVVRGAQFEKH
jgi:hypothetical protein